MSREEMQHSIVDFLKSRNATKVGLFGSFARKEDVADSDVDIVVEFKDGISFFQLAWMEAELSEKLGRKVDLITDVDLNPKFMDAIANDLQTIYQ